MNLHRMLMQRAADGKPLRVALIGAGTFGSMFLSTPCACGAKWNACSLRPKQPPC